MSVGASADGSPWRVPVARGPVVGAWNPPGSKSLTQRWMLLAALAQGTSRIENALRSDDIEALAEGLVTLGAELRWIDATTLQVRGVGGRFPCGGMLHAREGGTPARFLMTAAAMSEQPSVVDGSTRLRERPMRDGAELLRAMGAEVRRLQHGELPLAIEPGRAFRRGGEFEVDRPASSQCISAAALVAPWLERGLRLRVRGGAPSGSYVALTLQCLRQVGVPCGWDGERLTVSAAPVRAFEVRVEPDASSAAYGLALAAVIPGSRVHVPGLRADSAQPDVAVWRALRSLGAHDAGTPDAVGLAADGAGGTRELDASDWPDGSLAIMAAASAWAGPVRILGLGTLAGKESDRIEAMGAWLAASGATVERGVDWVRIGGPWSHRNLVTVHTCRDHRVAMSAAVVGSARGGIDVLDPRCVEKSWPGFWGAWADLVAS